MTNLKMKLSQLFKQPHVCRHHLHQKQQQEQQYQHLYRQQQQQQHQQPYQQWKLSTQEQHKQQEQQQEQQQQHYYFKYHYQNAYFLDVNFWKDQCPALVETTLVHHNKIRSPQSERSDDHDPDGKTKITTYTSITTNCSSNTNIAASNNKDNNNFNPNNIDIIWSSHHCCCWLTHYLLPKPKRTFIKILTYDQWGSCLGN